VGLQVGKDGAQVGIDLLRVVKGVPLLGRRVGVGILQGDQGIVALGGRPGPPLIDPLRASAAAVQGDDERLVGQAFPVVGEPGDEELVGGAVGAGCRSSVGAGARSRGEGVGGVKGLHADVTKTSAKSG